MSISLTKIIFIIRTKFIKFTFLQQRGKEQITLGWRQPQASPKKRYQFIFFVEVNQWLYFAFIVI